MARISWSAVAGVVVALVSLALFFSACGGGEEAGEEPTATQASIAVPTATELAEEPAATSTAPAETPAKATTIDVSLSEFKVSLSADTAPAGTVTFSLMNDGTVVHNLRVIKTDLAADELPMDEAAFTVDEDQVDVLASGSNLDANTQEKVTVDLAPGSYVLICNIPTHYDAGTRTTFMVE